MTERKPVRTPIKVAVHRSGQNPLFGEGALSVSVDDEGGGAFIVLEGEDEHGIRIDMDELEVVVEVAHDLIAGYNRAMDGGDAE